MVKKYDIHGKVYHEPPYTKAEENDLYARMGSVSSFTRPCASTQEQQKPSQPAREEPHRA